MQILSRVRGVDPFTVLGALVAVAVLVRMADPAVLTDPRTQAWATVFAAVCIQATPYVVLGVALAAVIAVVPADLIRRCMPRRAAIAVPVAAMLGCALPGCECGSVPVAASMLRRGVPTGAALSFMLSAPATNPVVLAATAAAFPGRPELVLARFVASLATSILMGWLWPRGSPPRTVPDEHRHGRHACDLLALAGTDLARSLGLLTVGAASAATMVVLVPPTLLSSIASSPAVGVAVAGALAVVLAVCSEADAFIASSLTQFSAVAQLTFMVVGPAVDVKLAAMQAGTLGGRFALRFGALTFVVAIGCAALVGAVLL